MQDAPQEILDQWGLIMVGPVANTDAAQVWKVKTADGTNAALKLYHRPDRGNEAPGSRLLSAWQDRGAVRIFEEAGNAILMEWLDGPSLGDVARENQAVAALNQLAQTARRLHHHRLVGVPRLKPLSQVFAPLYNCGFHDSCPTALANDMKRAIGMARDLLDTQTTEVPLHGDLHPDNVILTENGPRVIDAKGYLGDPAFELSNALRHPKGRPQLIRKPQQIEKCLNMYAKAMAVPHQRLARWAAAKCALSIFWRSNGPVIQDAEADLLSLLLRAVDQ